MVEVSVVEESLLEEDIYVQGLVKYLYSGLGSCASAAHKSQISRLSVQKNVKI